MNSVEPPHLTDEQLLLHADGELAVSLSEQVRVHLESCWSCRARLDDLHASIHTVVRFLNEVLLPTAPPPAPWSGLRPRMEALRTASRRPSLGTRVRRVWESRTLFLGRAYGVAAALAVALVAVMLWPRTTVVSAKELLAGADERLVSSAHRRLVLEERVPSRTMVVARRRIDIWRNQTTGAIARRVYDDREQLLAAEWTSADGARTVYERGGRPHQSERPAAYELTIDDLWRAEPSGTDFIALAHRPVRRSSGREGGSLAEGGLARNLSDVRVRDARDAYVVTSAQLAADDSLLSVSLTLTKDTWHPISQTIEVRCADEVHEFRLTETSFTLVSPDAIPLTVLQPDPELFGPAGNVATTRPSAASGTRRILSNSELIDLEIDTLATLNLVGAFLGEQVAVRRDSVRAVVQVEGIVDTTARKRELLDALQPLKPDGVVANIRTVDEALQHGAARSSRPTVLKSVEIDEKAPMPVYEDLLRYVKDEALREGGRQTEADESVLQREIQLITVKVLEKSLNARLHARALIQVLERFSPDDVGSLSAVSHRKWHELIREHAGAFHHDTEALRVLVQPIFFPGPPRESESGIEEVRVTSDADLSRAAARLFELGSFHDAEVARAFSVSADAVDSRPPNWHAFSRSLRSAERLAARIGELSVDQ